jgi:hypothetical protein
MTMQCEWLRCSPAPRADGTPERASNITPRHYAQWAAASMPLSESPSVRRRRPTVRRLRRPHNGRYVQCPPHGARAPRGGRFAPSLIAMADQNNSGSLCRARAHHRCSHHQKPFAVGPLSLAPCSPCQGQGEWPKTATLDTAARGADRDRPTALESEWLKRTGENHAALRSHPRITRHENPTRL